MKGMAVLQSWNKVVKSDAEVVTDRAVCVHHQHLLNMVGMDKLSNLVDEVKVSAQHRHVCARMGTSYVTIS